MSNVHDLPARCRRIDRARILASLFLVGVSVLTTSHAPAAVAAPAVTPTVPAGFTITKLADAPKGASNCDDLAFLDGHLFMGCENKTLNTGGSGESTLVEVTPAGTVVHTWSIKHQINGLAGDPLTHAVIVSLDENANPLMATVRPSATAGQQVTYYRPLPNPDASTTPIALRTGGGTNHVSVDAAGHVLVSASNAQTTTGTAVCLRCSGAGNPLLGGFGDLHKEIAELICVRVEDVWFSQPSKQSPSRGCLTVVSGEWRQNALLFGAKRFHDVPAIFPTEDGLHVVRLENRECVPQRLHQFDAHDDGISQRSCRHGRTQIQACSPRTREKPPGRDVFSHRTRWTQVDPSK